MTNEEAIEQIKMLKAFTGYEKDNPIIIKLHEALDMAITAIEDKGYEQGYADGWAECLEVKADDE